MKNLLVAIAAVAFAYLVNYVGFWLSLIVVLILSFYVFGYLLYQTQLLPNNVMDYLDNRLIHDGKTHKEVRQILDSINMENAVNAGTENSFLDTDELSGAGEIEESNVIINPLTSLVINVASECGVQCNGIEGLDAWISSLSKENAKSQVSFIIDKIKEARGIVSSVNLVFNDDSAEVRV